MKTLKLLLENYIVLQNLMHNLDLKLDIEYNKNRLCYLIKLNNNTLCFFETYDYKRHELFNKKNKVSLKHVKYGYTFRYVNNISCNSLFFKSLQEIKNFLKDSDINNDINKYKNYF